MESFKSVAERLGELQEARKHVGEGMTLGNKFLNDALDGIYRDDLVIITAKAGHGKTELAYHIATANALTGKKVHLFALEAHHGEVEARAKYKLLASAFFTQSDWRTYGETPRYLRWMHGKQDHLLGKFEPEIDQIMSKNLSTLYSYYLGDKFNVEDFEGEMLKAARAGTDLVIVDHLHYFDLDDVDEVRALRKTIRQIRTITKFYRKPTVVVAHIRKQDKKGGSVIPDMDDIYGSSDISKIATVVIATARARDREAWNKTIFPTYIQILKSRLDGSLINYTGLCGFDIVRNKYLDNYTLGKIKFGTDEFVRIEDQDRPEWSRAPAGKSEHQMELLCDA